jgi:hypothetical protein
MNQLSENKKTIRILKNLKKRLADGEVSVPFSEDTNIDLQNHIDCLVDVLDGENELLMDMAEEEKKSKMSRLL